MVDYLIDTEKWMEKLPDKFHNYPLVDIAIPGSHNSFTYNIDKNNNFCYSSLPEFLKNLLKFKLIKNIVYNFSINQSLKVDSQLKAGIRYFDIRVAKINDDGDDGYYSVHGLYGNNIMDYLEEIKNFLLKNNKEIVILDFNHFYDMNDEDHSIFVSMVTTFFENMIYPYCSPRELTLNKLWEINKQIIIIYHSSISDFHDDLFPRKEIRSRWPDKDNWVKIEEVLNEEWNGEKINCFKAYQGILTPSNSYIMKNLNLTLKNSLLNDKFFLNFSNWLKSRNNIINSFTSGCDNYFTGSCTEDTKCNQDKNKNKNNNQLNIFISDFVEYNDFCINTITLNK